MRDERSLKKTRPKRKAKESDGSNASSLIPHPSSLPLVAVIMGSQSDWETMRRAHEMLNRFDVPHECLVVSAHRTPA